MQRRTNSILNNLDWLTVGIYFILVIMGWFNIYSAVLIEDQHETFSMATRYGKQLIWVGASVVILIIALIIDSKFYSSFAAIIYASIIFLLLAVLLVGTEINGATSWIVIGPIRLQPAEFSKVATALALAKFLGRHNFKPTEFKTFIGFSLIAFFPVVLILAQNDTGSALVFFIFLLVYFREGMPSIYLIVGLLAGVLFLLSLILPTYTIIMLIEAFALISLYILRRNRRELLVAFIPLVVLTVILWIGFSYLLPDTSKTISVVLAPVILSFWYIVKIYKHKIKHGYFILAVLFASISFTYSVDYVFDNVLGAHQQLRIKVLLGLESDPYGAGYNVNQSMIAIGSGGPAGKGYLQGTQTKFKFVPEQSTDFIFCTVGEEWGFLGTTVVLLLFLALLIRLVFLAERQKSKFSRIYGYGVACIFFFHVAINVGMTIGLAPVIGIPLPFFSYGGSSLWAFTLLLFIFLKLDANRDQLIT